MAKVPASKELIKKIADLRHKGYSHERVAKELGIAHATSVKYGPKDAKTVKLPHPDDPDYKYKFTRRQIQIAIKALENREKQNV